MLFYLTASGKPLRLETLVARIFHDRIVLAAGDEAERSRLQALVGSAQASWNAVPSIRSQHILLQSDNGEALAMCSQDQHDSAKLIRAVPQNHQRRCTISEMGQELELRFIDLPTQPDQASQPSEAELDVALAERGIDPTKIPTEKQKRKALETAKK